MSGDSHDKVVRRGARNTDEESRGGGELGFGEFYMISMVPDGECY